ncbi:hypothetical protein QAD02_012867 [Eretmocerus hayati]|uniref:Uncharacterized protein n=1 Tax=Eretmocerus hayati TaxID=131215 RepID=A0ACC2P0K1_9HYME|nr:hypothetical protein QAD02_012867 [Eretmocerus hayati]
MRKIRDGRRNGNGKTVAESNKSHSILEDYAETESEGGKKSEYERGGINNNERKSTVKVGEGKRRKTDKETEDKDEKERRLKKRHQKRSSMKGEDYSQWNSEGLDRKTSCTHDAWVVETYTQQVEEKLLETMKARGEKESAVKKFISAEERWQIKRNRSGKERITRSGYKAREHRRGHCRPKRSGEERKEKEI